MGGKEEFLKLFPAGIREMLANIPVDMRSLREIKFRINKPVICYYNNREVFITRDGRLSGSSQAACIMSARELEELVNYIGSFSLYAYEDELRQGYLTVKGGHRAGIAGKVIMENGYVKNFKYISCVNIRVAHEVKGAADAVLPYLYTKGRFLNTLIISPPGCGKTTLLRDIIRQASDGSGERRGLTVGLVDERSEIGGSYLGVPQNDLGLRTDILDACPKAEGMMMLIRAMSPDIVAVDEIGTDRDVAAMEAVIRCGARLLATIHGETLTEIRCKPAMAGLMGAKVFERCIVLDADPHVGHIAGIYDREDRRLGGM